ncbi:MAG: glutamate-5-semialdehyde dehydrogenase [Alphaproteobacteria bacterium]|nr:glutamate-5-semialdehyde dehydrogenase [Alphaproteobacteria bacterium]
MTAVQAETRDDIRDIMHRLGAAARVAARALSSADAAAKSQALRAAATAVRGDREVILAANARDVSAAVARGTTAAFLDRLKLDPDRIGAMADGLEAVADLPDPVGRTLAEWQRPNGLVISRVSVPLGVIGIIYESRPNVTADAGSLCLKSGNATILRGGSESFHSSTAIAACLQHGLRITGLPETAIQMVPTTDRAAVGEMLTMRGVIDIIVPRGGKSLIERVAAESRIPIIGHLEGLCHVYVHAAADPEMARDIVVNAKMRRTGICGAAETIMVDRGAVDRHLSPILKALFESGCAVRGDNEVQQCDPRVSPASEEDWSTEYLDAIVSIRVVDDIDGALAHIERYGSHHTDSIVTEDADAAARFLAEVDSAIVLHNASTQFADGGEFGMGAEIGISTDRLHARGPVGAEQLTSFKYVVRGTGHIRP